MSRRVFVTAAGATLAAPALAWPSPSRAATSDWAKSRGAAVRLIDAGPAPGGPHGDWLAGIEIALDPGTITYWRSPGDAGLPPTADFAGSTNVREAVLLFPAPSHFDEAGSDAFGYAENVIFPVHVTPADPAQPVTLRLALAFAVCDKLCRPGNATLSLPLVSDGHGPEADRVLVSMQRVPRSQAVGSDAPLAIASIAPTGEPDHFAVLVRTPEGAPPQIFAEAPEGWFLTADTGAPAGAGLTRFVIAVASRPDGASGAPPSATLTVVTPADAIEVTSKLDGAPSAP